MADAGGAAKTGHVPIKEKILKHLPGHHNHVVTTTYTSHSSGNGGDQADSTDVNNDGIADKYTDGSQHRT